MATDATSGPGKYSGLRVHYEQGAFEESDLSATPLEQFEAWFAAAEAHSLPEPNAMVVATATPDGRPSARHVLLKGLDRDGFVFYTNYDSRKGRELTANPQVTLVFPWFAMFRQVTVEGRAERVRVEESTAYFNSRPYGSRIGAWASLQSEVMSNRNDFDARYAEISSRFPDEVPLPPNWGGFRVRPFSLEFWAGRESRMHDRLQYVSVTGEPTPLDVADAWQVRRLFP